MKWLLGIAAVLVLLAAAGGAVVWWQLRPLPPLAPATDEFALIDVTVINPHQSRADHQVVLVGDGEIRKITNVIDAAGDLRVEDYRRHYVLPGLIDLHTHLPPATALHLTDHSLLLYLAFGVTAIREVGDVDGSGVEAARRAQAQLYPSPRVFACGPFVAGGPPRWANTVVLDGPQAADGIVQGLKARLFDCIKSYDDLDAREIVALVDAARNSGLPVLGHIPVAVAYEDALVPEVQHLHGVVPADRLNPQDAMTRLLDWESVDDARIDAFVRSTVERGIAHTPTLVTNQQLLRYADYAAARREPFALLLPRLYRDIVWSPSEGLSTAKRMVDPSNLAKLRAAFEKKKEVVRRLHAAGAQLLLGTDVLQPLVAPGISLHQEMRLMAECGIPLGRLWAMATWQAADILRQPDLARIRVGAPADMLIFRQDPTEDLAALDSLVAVVSHGRLYRREQLDAAIAAYRRHFEDWIFDQVSVTATRSMLARASDPAAHRH
ncbi:MAG TPA: amidohydrolase family protein [Terriglobales bacterium]|nr:amidohydrolase family protein [Terriglobales bacterium]